MSRADNIRRFQEWAAALNRATEAGDVAEARRLIEANRAERAERAQAESTKRKRRRWWHR